jgi:toxin ParE1/3/4
MKPILLHTQAKTEMREARDYYEEQKPDLGFEFVEEVEDGIERIQQNPRGFPVFQNSSYRRCLLKRFPYRILFRESDQDIRIIAIAHFKRKPDYWKKRSFPEETA